jgi:ABC-2 type transport system ATP-binding protein
VTPSVTLEAVSKWYGEVMGLNEVTASFGPGVTGLLGPNGAGKSTFLKLVCGALRPSLGTVRVCGADPVASPSVMRRVGLCPEQDALYPGAAVLDVLAYLTRLHAVPRREARDRARAALERVGLGHALHRSAATFSKGMRQRAKLAQAFAHDPDVLVLDEPLNGLDPPGRRDLCRVVRELGEEGRCVVVSSHVLHEVEGLAGQVLLLHSGRVLAEGTVREIRAQLPEFPLTVRIGTPDADRLAPLLLEDGSVRRLERLGGGLEVLAAHPDAFFDHLARVVAREGLRLESLAPVDEDLEAVFRYLTR